MVQRLHDFERLTLQATDGELGRVDDFLFDEELWTIRYLVVSTGSLFGRRVAISPISIVEPNWAEGRLSVQLTYDQIRNSPDLLSTRQITRSAEHEYASYYGYPAYWGGPSLWGWAGFPGALAGLPPMDRVDGDVLVDPSASQLRSVAGLRGAHLHSNDGEIGHVDDVVVDDESWSARYLLVDTSNWIGGRHVLVPTARVATVDWLGRRVHVDLLTERVRQAPEYDPNRPLDRTTEHALAMYYDPPSVPDRERSRASGARR